jgi:hypothetical protein
VGGIILVDGRGTVGRDRPRLGIHVIHERTAATGNQKTCYATALGRADSYRWSPTGTTRPYPHLLAALRNGGFDAAFGSRMLGGRPIQGGMPKWKFFGNILLTAIENATFLIYLTEYHSGFRAYTRKYLEAVNLEANSDGFVFDTEIIAQGMAKELRICEIPIATRYFDEASQIAFAPSVRYGLAILKTMLLYKLHVWGIWTSRIFGKRGPSTEGWASELPCRSCRDRLSISWRRILSPRGGRRGSRG